MRNNEATSQSLSLQVWERQHSGQGNHQHLARKNLKNQMGSGAGKVLSPAGESLQQPMLREINVAWSSLLGCGAQLSQQWPGNCLSDTLLGFLISVLAPLIPRGEFPQEFIYRWSCSADAAVLVTCADILGESPYQMCLD